MNYKHFKLLLLSVFAILSGMAHASQMGTVTFAAGEATGTVPAAVEEEAGKTITLPTNYTLYVEGKTLTGWSDGTNQYAPGETYTVPEENVTLTAVFTENEVNLSDRTEPVTVKFDFQKKNGAPNVQWQNQAGLVWVAQATVGGKTIDVAAKFSTAPGKFNNTNWPDWCQINEGTTFTIPSAKGAVVSVEGYNALTALTIDGQNDYTSGKTVSYTVASSAATVDVVFGSEGQYYRYIQVVLPVVESQGGGESYENKSVSVTWPIEDKDHAEDYTTENADLFSVISANYGDLTLGKSEFITNEKGESTGVKGTFFRQGSGSTTTLQWTVKPVAGLTFTPTKVSGYVNRDGTDVENGLTISVAVDGETTKLGTWTALRRTKTSSQKPYDATAIYKFEVELTTAQQAAMATTGEFTLVSTLPVTNTAKDGVFGNVVIEGVVNGTAVNVEKYTLTAAANIAEGGTVSVYPAADEYETGSTVKLTATEQFGYDFVNWTNADGEVVSTEAVYTFDIDKDETLTANFKAVETYELALTVDGTNDYMVAIDPAPEMVDGKMMYEAGTAVQLTANQYDGLVAFNNWSTGETASSKLINMTENMTLTAVYSNTVDILAGWDFYLKGNEGRVADFASENNASAALSLVKTGTDETSSWLDKSTLATGGYESFKGAAVNWNIGSKNGDVGYYHWQTKVNAKDFTNINVQFQMLYNYNAYKKYNAEYSLDGTTWTNFGSVTMSGAKAPVSFSKTLPAACNNQADLYIRLIADKTSSIDGSASANDGNTLAMFFITGTQALADDGVAPVLFSTVPADGAASVSASGKVVLTFNEKVQVAEGTTATLGSLTLTPVVSGKSIAFEYKGLEYSTEYTFTLPANAVSDLTGNTLTEAVTFSFTTMTRPTVEKGLYDAVVSNADELLAAINAANKRSDTNTRYRIFLMNGTYTLPLSTTETINSDDGNTYPAPYTSITASNISFIGESRDGVTITNDLADAKTYNGKYGATSVYDGIGKSDVLQLQGPVRGTYFQDLTVKSGINDALGRNLAIQDKGSQSIYKNTVLWGYQDTWTSNNDNGLYYFEGGKVRGRTDFLCGKGDAFFNAVDIQVCMNTGGYIAVPSKSIKYGYVFKGCNILCESSSLNGKYTLGRPWGQGTPVALWIDTKMQYAPSAIGWSEMSDGWPKQFAEWNSTLTNGTVVDLSGRKTTFGDGHTNVPVMTADQALEAGDPHNVFGDWDPTLLTEQAPMPQNVRQEGNALVWDGSNYALLWAIVKDGSVVDFTTEPTYELTESGQYAVRAANEMGGLSEASAAVEATVAEVVKVKLNANGYATLASQKALDFSAVDGLTAYIVSSTTATEATLTSVASAPVATGLVLKGAAGAEYTIPAAETADAVSSNLLVAAVGATTVEAESVYVLDGSTFKVFAGTQIPAGKAYLPKADGARQLTLVFADATGINANLNANLNWNGNVVDLQGRRVAKPGKGVYIVGGKKVIVK